MLQANVLAGDVKANQQVGVLATARGQTADAGSGLAQAAKLARSEDLNKATARLSRATNIMGNISKLGSSIGRLYSSLVFVKVKKAAIMGSPRAALARRTSQAKREDVKDPD